MRNWAGKPLPVNPPARAVSPGPPSLPATGSGALSAAAVATRPRTRYSALSRWYAPSRATVVVGVIVLLAAIHISYQFVVSPRYAYQLLVYITPNTAVYAAMLALIVGMSLILPIRLSRPGDFLLWIVYILVIVPSLTISYLAGTLPDETQITLGLVVSACFSLAIVAGRAHTPDLLAKIKPLSVRAAWICIIAFSAVTYLSLAASGSLRFSIPGLDQVYSVRSAFVSANAANKLLGYVMPNQSNVINPLILAIGVCTRRKWLIVVALIGELLLFGAAGHKTVLFAVPAVLAVAWVFRGGRRPAAALLLWGFVGLIAAAAIFDAVLSTNWLSSLFTRRFIDVPGLLTGAWIHVFSGMPKAHFAYGFLAPFLDYPYSVAPSYLVANMFFGNATLNANANMLADGYANFGWFGIAFEVAIFAGIVVLANSLSTRVPLRAAVMLLVMPAVAMSNASVLTSLLTHGVALALVVMAVLPPAIWTRRPDSGKTASSIPPVGTIGSAGDRPAGATARGAVGRDPAVLRSPLGAPTLSWWQRAKARERATGADGMGPGTPAA